MGAPGRQPVPASARLPGPVHHDGAGRDARRGDGLHRCRSPGVEPARRDAGGHHRRTTTGRRSLPGDHRPPSVDGSRHGTRRGGRRGGDPARRGGAGPGHHTGPRRPGRRAAAWSPSRARSSAADLVVDAGGRRSAMPTWLREAGSPGPKEEVDDAGLPLLRASLPLQRRVPPCDARSGAPALRLVLDGHAAGRPRDVERGDLHGVERPRLAARCTTSDGGARSSVPARWSRTGSTPNRSPRWT